MLQHSNKTHKYLKVHKAGHSLNRKLYDYNLGVQFCKFEGEKLSDKNLYRLEWGGKGVLNSHYMAKHLFDTNFEIISHETILITSNFCPASDLNR